MKPKGNLVPSSEEQLDHLADDINKHHQEAERKARSAIMEAIGAGELLIQARQQIPHGQWNEWLNNNTHIPERTARHYMALAKNKTALKDKTADLADLTISQAVKLIPGKKTALLLKPKIKGQSAAPGQNPRSADPQEAIDNYKAACIAVTKITMTPHDAFEVAQRAVSTLKLTSKVLREKEAENIRNRLNKIIVSQPGG